METYIINRDDRPGRLAHATTQLALQGLNARRFSAVIGVPGWKGCRDSHIELLKKCEKENIILILEDDVLFLNNFYDVVIPAMRELPWDWDCLYLGASPKEPQERYSEHLFRLRNAHVTHAIMWHYRPYGAVQRIIDDREMITKIDVYFAKVIQPNFNCFVTYPIVATQTGSFKSDTCHRSNVLTIEENFNKYCL